MLKDVPQFVPQNVCLACEGCCRFDQEFSGWRPKLGESEREFLTEIIFSKKKVDRHHMVKAEADGVGCHCTFFDMAEKVCSIYRYRPFECRLYPFLLMKHSDQVNVGVHLACPHIQDQQAQAVYQNFQKELKAYFNDPATLAFLKDNPALIRDYSAYLSEIDILFPVPLSHE